MKSTTYMVEELVRKTRVLLYQGIYGLQDGVVSTEAWMRQMNWDGLEGFLETKRKVWKVDEELLGYVQRFRSFSHVVISGSGHLVAVDKGSSAQTMIDHQPSGSVLFASFGSEGTLSSEQLVELAWGLELSWQHFLWVIRSRSGANNATLLPEGYIERNNEVGLVGQSLIPQMEIVGNTSTGRFLTHCGWNSVLERIMSGVPMITWPLYAEQKINVKLLVNGIAVGLKSEVLCVEMR